MILLDELKIEWGKNDRIKIRYLKDDNEHYYLPDFIVKIKDSEYIIEMKGFDWDGDTELKSKFAKEEYVNYRIFYDIDELEDFLTGIK
jgi:hypothetical protein